MTQMLIQDGTGMLYHYTEALAKRTDMKLYAEPEPEDARNTLTNGSATADTAPPAEGDEVDWRALTSKAELEAFARTKGVELDKRRSLGDMRADFLAALQAREQTPGE